MPEQAAAILSGRWIVPNVFGSLTTIGGLTPLMFETSLQAQYLVPMAVSIAFGLGVATFLVLLLVPALLCLHEAVATRWEGRAARAMAGTG